MLRDAYPQAGVPPALDRAHQRPARAGGITYSKFMAGLKKANIEIDRKSCPTWHPRPAAFGSIVEKVKAQLA